MATTFSPHYLPSVDPTLYYHAQQPGYYDSSAFYPHFYQQENQQQDQPQQQLTRPPSSNPILEAEDLSADPILALNLRVLRRHLPSTLRILYQAQYAVIYTFSPQSTGWEKSGKEGTLFIVEETARPGAQNIAALVVLNRRGMDNFVMRDWDPQVQSEGGHIILRGRVEGEAVTGGPGAGGENGGEGEDLTVWGVWIWEEEDLRSTRGKREGVETCLVACAAGDVTEAEGQEPETTVGPDGDGAVFEEQDKSGGGSWEEFHQQQQQQHQQHWDHQQADHFPQNIQPQQHFQDHHHHHPPLHPQPPFSQQPYLQQQQQQQPGLSYQPIPSQPPEGQPASPNLMALLNGRAPPITHQQSAPTPPLQPTNTQLGNANANTNAGRDILGDLFRNAAAGR